MSGARAAKAFDARAWGAAFGSLSAVPRGELTDTELDQLAVAAYLVGDDEAAIAAWEHAYGRHIDAGRPADAARCAFWAAFCQMMRGHMAHAGGWLSRGASALGPDLDCPARGYLLIPGLLGSLDAGDASRARVLAEDAVTIAGRFDDHDLAALATLGHGQALLASGDEAAGLAQLDDVMLAVSAGEVGPIVSGVVYCAVVLECMQRFDLARAAEWTAALDAWCAAQPDLVAYRGQCLVHQSQLRQAAGDWPEAMERAADACDRLSDPPHPALALAHYQAGELHRLRGDVDAAAAAYARASKAGYEPMPGIALLDLQRGASTSAAGSIGRALSEDGPAFQRPGLLVAAVEIYTATGDAVAASAAAAELSTIAASSASPVLAAMAAQARGAALLASSRPAEAMAHLRSAAAAWQRLEMPYEAARCAVLVGAGCAALADATSASLEFDNARAAFAALGALPDLRQLSRDLGVPAHRGVLTAREQEVLRLVGEGRTTREIAASLTISHHTVRRHLENTFTKLGVSSRAAAIASAYEHDLL